MPLFTRDEIRAGFAEFIALALFVFVGCGAAVSSQVGQAKNEAGQGPAMDGFLVSVALAFGIGISVLAYGIGHISGGHINPAVTFGFFILGKIKFPVLLLYWFFQTTGAILGAVILWGCTVPPTDQWSSGSPLNPSIFGNPAYTLGSNSLNENLNLGSGFFIEFMGTFLLVWTVMMSAAHPGSGAGNAAPIAIGWSVFLAHIVLIPWTGCGINPARSFGPHLIMICTGEMKVGIRGWWIFYTAPFVGAAFATLIAKYIYGAAKDDVYDEEGEEPAEAEPEVESKVETNVDEKADEMEG